VLKETLHTLLLSGLARMVSWWCMYVLSIIAVSQRVSLLASPHAREWEMQGACRVASASVCILIFDG